MGIFSIDTSETWCNGEKIPRPRQFLRLGKPAGAPMAILKYAYSLTEIHFAPLILQQLLQNFKSIFYDVCRVTFPNLKPPLWLSPNL